MTLSARRMLKKPPSKHGPWKVYLSLPSLGKTKADFLCFLCRARLPSLKLSLLLRCLSRSFTFHCGVGFWPCCTACGPLVPWPGIEPRSLAVTAESPPLGISLSLLFKTMVLKKNQGCVEMKLPVCQQVLSKEPTLTLNRIRPIFIMVHICIILWSWQKCHSSVDDEKDFKVFTPLRFPSLRVMYP